MEDSQSTFYKNDEDKSKMKKSSLTKDEKEEIMGEGVTLPADEYWKLVLKAEDNYREEEE